MTKMLRLIEDVHHIEVYMKDSRMVKFFPKDLEDAPDPTWRPRCYGDYYAGGHYINFCPASNGCCFEGNCKEVTKGLIETAEPEEH